MLLINWWGLFRWSNHTEWHIVQFFFLTCWATVHFLLAVSLYPYEFLDEITGERQRRFFLITLIVLILFDLGEAAIRDELFDPWFYPLFMFYMLAIVVTALVNARETVQRVAGWATFISVLIWSLIMRALLTS